MKQKLLFILLTCISISLSSIDFDLDGEIKERVIDNLWEVRVKLGTDLEILYPYYFKTEVELGYLEIDNSLSLSDLTDIEVNRLYFGLKEDLLHLKLGIVPVKTPKEYIFNDNSFALEFDLDFGKQEVSGFYSAVNLFGNNLMPIDDVKDLDHILFVEYRDKNIMNMGFWLTYYEENEYYKESSWDIWTGFNLKEDIESLSFDYGYIYQFGMVLETRETSSSWYTFLELEYELSKLNSLSSLITYNGGKDSFTTADDKGEFSSDLKILLDDTFYTDALTLEVAYNREFNMIPLELSLITGGLFDESGINNWEIDFNSQLELGEHLELEMNLAYLFDNELQFSSEISYSF